ncbi:OLC1v1023523C3 [Oldenlandia corymbosa var. corymbosa]|nr:OLC1v1023523C3 [Oldenlandia corymbosa var. corymbosa]
MRLSEAAENLRHRAAVNVRNGKENEARELLFQKKKVMEAMEKSKDRIELLDELSAKLNEVISVKENDLIENVAIDLNMGGDAEPSPIIFVSPKEKVQESANGNDEFAATSSNVALEEDLRIGAESLREPSDNELIEGSVDGKVKNEVDVAHKLLEVSSYEDFLEQVDGQLRKIEVELITLLKFSKLMLESKENVENEKVRHTLSILEDVHHVRERIAKIKEAEVGTRLEIA